ncbi:uncharacterized protein ARMOST_02382 [Armillaria ostoyae]|uniref:Uncharacterized protein n=1 Tax=Armillaria ostoyae TaxID=47428 RepID=A0A284QRK6_ARMOS|nr:uncharacterized protein ARMOST_02382 [Armillaria ostoyae]
MFFLRRLRRRTVTASRSFSELQSQAGSRRTVLVRNLPQGYDISNVIGTIKANPVEAIIPGDDQLTVRFLKTSPKLSAYAAAAIGYSRLSRWMTLRNLPHDLREEDLRTYIIPREVEYSLFDPIERQAQIGFLDLRQALRVRQEIFSHSYFEEVGLSFDQRDEN